MEPLVLWEDPEGKQEPISVDNMLVKFLRPHQREAGGDVQSFLYVYRST